MLNISNSLQITVTITAARGSSDSLYSSVYYFVTNPLKNIDLRSKSMFSLFQLINLSGKAAQVDESSDGGRTVLSMMVLSSISAQAAWAEIEDEGQHHHR